MFYKCIECAMISETSSFIYLLVPLFFFTKSVFVHFSCSLINLHTSHFFLPQTLYFSSFLLFFLSLCTFVFLSLFLQPFFSIPPPLFVVYLSLPLCRFLYFFRPFFFLFCPIFPFSLFFFLSF